MEMPPLKLEVALPRIVVVEVVPTVIGPLEERIDVEAFAKVARPEEVMPVKAESEPAMVESPVTARPPEDTVSVVGVVRAPVEEMVVVPVPPK